MSKSEIIIKIALVAVIILLIISIGFLVFILTHRDDLSTSSDNVIGMKNETIKLEDSEEIETKRFNVSNMFPGDSVTKSYTIEVLDDKTESVSFHAEIKSDNASLSDVLYITLTIDDSTHPVFRGTVADIPEDGFPTELNGETITYHVTVTLDTSAGNECQNGEIVVDLFWGASGVEFSSGRTQGRVSEDTEIKAA